jgi:large subunit ribosomal protein L29
MPSAFELRELDDVELEDRLGDYRKELLNLRFQLATGQLDNAARVGQVKRDVARVLTILRDREIALAEGRDPTTGHAPAVPDELAGEPRRRARKPRKAADDEFETEDDVQAAAEDDVEDEIDTEIDTEDAGGDAGDDGEDA